MNDNHNDGGSSQLDLYTIEKPLRFINSGGIYTAERKIKKGDHKGSKTERIVPNDPKTII